MDKNKRKFCKLRCFLWVFVCFSVLGVFVPLEKFSLLWRRHHYRWRAAHFNMCSDLMAIEQWGSLACHTYSDTDIHLYWSSSKTRDTHTLSRAFSCGAVTTCKHHLRPSRLGFEHPPFRIRGERSNRLRHCHSFLWVREANMQIYHKQFIEKLCYLKWEKIIFQYTRYKC